MLETSSLKYEIPSKEKYWSSKTNRGRSCCCCMVSRNSDNFIIPYLHPRERKKNYNHFPLTHQPINLQIKAIKKQSKCEEGRKCDEEILWRKQLPLLPWDLPIVLTELAFESQMRSVCPEVTTSSPPSPWLAKSGRLQCFLKTRGEFITLASKSAAVHLENNFLKVNVFA
nr:uncharacterized protein LOC129012684 isoform X2 [Pongo pygmaeus]